MRQQGTIGRIVTVQGPGLHSGVSARVSIEPAPEGHGRVFFRADSSQPVPIPALASSVVSTELCTSLERDGQRVCTVEHLLAAMAGLAIDNAIIRVWGPEIPALDGSARPWVRLMLQAGRRRQRAVQSALRPLRSVEVADGPRRACCTPSDQLTLDVSIDFPHPLLAQRRLALGISSSGFDAELAWARTFALQDQAEAMRAAGLALGGSLDNAVVLGPAGVINPGGLRGLDEPLRHKMLDLLGDLALLGHPLLAHVRAEQPGHGFNLALVRALLEACEEVSEP
jgi:UDP-3-O-[3-hydroxymyristoyl] N-acetylglucosamine deacetylase